MQALLLNSVPDALSSSHGAIQEVLSIGGDGDNGLSQELQSLGLREAARKDGNPYGNQILENPAGTPHKSLSCM